MAEAMSESKTSIVRQAIKAYQLKIKKELAEYFTKQIKGAIAHKKESKPE